MVEQTGYRTAGNIMDFVGLSTDVKPTTCDAGSTFWELDTKKAYIFGNGAWWDV